MSETRLQGKYEGNFRVTCWNRSLFNPNVLFGDGMSNRLKHTKSQQNLSLFDEYVLAWGFQE